MSNKPRSTVKWKKTEAWALVDKLGWTRAVIVRHSQQRGEWEWFTCGSTGIGARLKAIKEACVRNY